ncbi:TonB-dependent siderophore receptor [Methylobacterium sp. J-048]|uniref:TonB-dependent siderophore receptor n=1 Tax=Methylobacterium sp. J-048 TaxID=2836635 RepID=UPI001FBAB3D7|nr:TonB-dependent siderophore receptor [Methylobacterium sp. J-048]MCJ2055879.1 TonB-dependent siderophore receptor [Methylobacterium sp. J-048]
MSLRSARLGLLLTSTALASAAVAPDATAQGANVQLNEISVEAARPASAPAAGAGAGNISRGDGNSSATSGGGGGPSGVTGYVARVSPTATKTNTPLIETPQSVSVVTREQLNDRNVQSLNEALAYTPGVSSNVFGFDPRFDSFYIRGFDETYTGVFRDGLRQSAVGFSAPRIEPYGTEAVTILRGPASGLYGLGSPGGIVDVTSKRPVFVPFGEVWFQGGNFDRYQGNFDIGSPVEGSDGTLAYRLTGAFRDSDTFLPSGKDNRFTIAPAITWKPSADTTFTLLTEYQRSKTPGVSTFYNAPGFVVTRLYQGDASFNAIDQESYRIGYAFEHKFTPDLIFRQNFRYQNIGTTLAYTQIDNVVGLSAQRSNGLIQDRLGSVALDNQLEAHLVTGPVAHTLIGGADYLHSDYRRQAGFGVVPDLDLTGITNFSTFRARTFVPRPALSSASEQTQDQIGLYIQEQAKFDRFVLTLTGRQDFVSQATRSGTPDSLGAAQSRNDSVFTGRVGLNYLLTPDLVPYASYATTFTPQNGVDINGRSFKPATGDQIEAGVKYAIPGTNITGAFAGFDIVQSSVLQTDPTNVANTVASGSVESKGFEAELTANFAPGTNLTIAYTHLDLRYLNATYPGTTQSITGNMVSGIPGDTFAAFGTYQFPLASPLRGLQIGGGIRFSGTSFTDDLNTVRNPTVTQFDALVAYDFAALDPKYKGFRAQINAFNIFDRDYYTCQTGFCYRGAPATVIGSLIYRW